MTVIDQGPQGRPPGESTGPGGPRTSSYGRRLPTYGPIAPRGHDGVDAVLAELEQAEAARAYRVACIDRVRSQIQLAALTARSQILSQILTEATTLLVGTPSAGDALRAGLTAADAESSRLLALLGVDLNAAGEA